MEKSTYIARIFCILKNTALSIWEEQGLDRAPKNRRRGGVPRLLCTLGASLLLAACASPAVRPGALLYDLGALPAATPPAVAPPALSLAEIGTPGWLDTPAMVYRLAYVNPQQPRSYADSHWSMPPAQLLGQRLKLRLAAAGGVVAAAADGALNLPLLRIELDDFSQTFSAPDASTAGVSLRATLFSGRLLLAQKTLTRQLPARPADAAGGAHALAAASDLVIDDLMQWLTTAAPGR